MVFCFLEILNIPKNVSADLPFLRDFELSQERADWTLKVQSYLVNSSLLFSMEQHNYCFKYIYYITEVYCFKYIYYITEVYSKT